MIVDFERSHCFEVTIRSVDGYRLRAQEGDKFVFHRFDLNPSLEEYEVAVFAIPEQSYRDDIKPNFDLQFLR